MLVVHCENDVALNSTLEKIKFLRVTVVLLIKIGKAFYYFNDYSLG